MKRINGNGLTSMQQSFVRAHAKTNHATFAAWQAGYANPETNGLALLRKPKVQSAVRQETQRYLYEDAGKLGVTVLGHVAVNENYPVGARVKAAEVLCKLANIAVKDEDSSIPVSEMSAEQLNAALRQVSADRRALDSILSALPRQAIEAQAQPDVFG